MSTVAQMRGQMYGILNESRTAPLFWTAQVVSEAIYSAVLFASSLTDVAFTVSREIPATGNSQLWITPSQGVRILRADRVGVNCNLRKRTVRESNDQYDCWRDCDYAADGGDTQFYVVDPMQPRSIWLVAPPEAGTLVSLTVVNPPAAVQIVDDYLLPPHLYNAILDLALGRCYERKIGVNAPQASYHRQNGIDELSAYDRKARDELQN